MGNVSDGARKPLSGSRIGNDTGGGNVAGDGNPYTFGNSSLPNALFITPEADADPSGYIQFGYRDQY